jgi:hypothetical protein
MVEVGEKMREPRLNANAEMEVIGDEECSKNTRTFYRS